MSIDKIIYIGKNHLEHALELGDATPDKPVVFLKPASTLRRPINYQDELILTFLRSEVRLNAKLPFKLVEMVIK